MRDEFGGPTYLSLGDWILACFEEYFACAIHAMVTMNRVV
jgi:hypothetical protein